MHLRPSVHRWVRWSENEVCSGALLARCYFEATETTAPLTLDQVSVGQWFSVASK